MPVKKYRLAFNPHFFNHNVLTRIKAFSINAFIELWVTVTCGPSSKQLVRVFLC
jgi:hypothetical protein